MSTSFNISLGKRSKEEFGQLCVPPTVFFAVSYQEMCTVYFDSSKAVNIHFSRGIGQAWETQALNGVGSYTMDALVLYNDLFFGLFATYSMEKQRENHCFSSVGLSFALVKIWRISHDLIPIRIDEWASQLHRGLCGGHIFLVIHNLKKTLTALTQFYESQNLQQYSNVALD